MKRLFFLVFALALAMSVVCGAAAAEKTFKTDYFTLKLPNGWDYDTEDAGVDEDGDEYLGLFGEDKDIGIIVFTYMMYYEDYKDVSLWNADKAEMNAYIEDLLYQFSDDEPEYLDTVMAGKIPFVLIKGTDEDGEYLYAETMTNGYAIAFDCYVFDEDGENQYPFTQKYVNQIKSILETFQPVT